MNSDIRISITFFQHHKTKKLIRRFGPEGIIFLQKIWVYAAQYRSKGRLDDMTAEDIAVAVDWMGEPDELVSTLCEIGFLKQCEEGIYLIHDWEVHNPWAFHAKERSEKASNAANARWGNAKKCPEHASSMPEASPSNAPSPTPTPTPKDTDDSSKSSGSRPKACPKEQWDKYTEYSRKYLEEQHERWGSLVQVTNSRIKAGAKALDNLIRVKGFPSQVVYETIEWGRNHEFWEQQIRSLGGLTKNGKNGESKFANMLASRTQEAQNAHRHA